MALRSDEFRALAERVEEEHGVRPDVSEANVYRSTVVEGRYAVDFPVGESAPSGVGVIIEDGEVVHGVGSVVTVTDGRVVEYTQFDVGSSGNVETNSVPLETEAQRQTALGGDSDFGDGPSVQLDDCSACIGALERICPYGCGISAAVLCALLGAVTFPGGLACAVFFAIYCVEISLSGACWYTSGPRGDCELMDFC